MNDMIREVTAMLARQTFGELLNEVKYRHDKILITKAGKPIAALIDIELFEKLRKMRYEFDTLTTELGSAYSGCEEEAAQNEISEAIKKTKKPKCR